MAEQEPGDTIADAPAKLVEAQRLKIAELEEARIRRIEEIRIEAQLAQLAEIIKAEESTQEGRVDACSGGEPSTLSMDLATSASNATDGSQLLPSVGSRGHPETCKPPCRFELRRSGDCRHGEFCAYCHSVHTWSDIRQRKNRGGVWEKQRRVASVPARDVP